MVTGDDVKVAATGVFADKNVAADKTVTLSSVDSGVDLANYAVTHQASTTASITPAALSIAAVMNSKTVDGSISAAAVPVVTGLIGSDKISGVTESYFDARTGSSKTINVNAGFVISDGNGGNNYAVALVANTDGVIVQPQPPVVVPATPIAPLATPSAPPAFIAVASAAPAVTAVANTAGIMVSMASPVTAQNTGMVQVSIPKDIASSGNGFVFALPAQAIGNQAASASSPVTVTTASGQELPNWIKFNPETNTFVAAVVPDGGLPLSLVVTVDGVSTTVNIATVANSAN